MDDVKYHIHTMDSKVRLKDGYDEGQIVESGGLPYSSAIVLKPGRTTGTAEGVVISTELIAWDGAMKSRLVLRFYRKIEKVKLFRMSG